MTVPEFNPAVHDADGAKKAEAAAWLKHEIKHALDAAGIPFGWINASSEEILIMVPTDLVTKASEIVEAARARTMKRLERAGR